MPTTFIPGDRDVVIRGATAAQLTADDERVRHRPEQYDRLLETVERLVDCYR